jgi:tetratricopeptide (TPR) repeat protein
VSFPLLSLDEGLLPSDFELFSAVFSQTVLHLIPYAEGPVSFVPVLKGRQTAAEADVWSAGRRENLQKVVSNRNPLGAIVEQAVYLPLMSGAELAGVVILEGVDPAFLKTLSVEWLHDRSRILSREFSLLKKTSYDQATGFLNSQFLQSELNSLLVEEVSFTLVLIEIKLRTTSPEKIQRHLSKAGYYLSSFFRRQPLIHLGFGIFAIIWAETSELQAQKHGKAVLDLLKRENFTSVHLGLKTVSIYETEEQLSGQGRDSVAILLDNAWQALRAARRRGPYSLCSHNAVAKNYEHPLAPPPPKIRSRLRSQWREMEKFCIACLQQETPSPSDMCARQLVPVLNDRGIYVFAAGQEIYALLGGFTINRALDWARSVNDKLAKQGRYPFSIGVAAFPVANVKKYDILLNAKKALLHTKFYGPGTITAFDAVSQNISGDIFYREGDLNRAVKEYRSGLALEPDNVNLLNSLGEAYAQMNRHKEAKYYFNEVLKADGRNYMALFNLGVVYSRLKEDDKAIDSFEKALAVSADLQEDEVSRRNRYDLSRDLLLPLGKLYCRTGRFEEAITLLADCTGEENGGDSEFRKKYVNHGGVLRYLGKAYKGQQMNREAMRILQRAIHHNPRDATSLSMLGELYCQEKQGEEIALTFCSRAVELDDTRWDYWYRLGWVLFQCGQNEEARATLQESLARNKEALAVRYLLGRTYQRLDQDKKAEKMFKLVLKQDPSHEQAQNALAAIRK